MVRAGDYETSLVTSSAAQHPQVQCGYQGPHPPELTTLDSMIMTTTSSSAHIQSWSSSYRGRALGPHDALAALNSDDDDPPPLLLLSAAVDADVDVAADVSMRVLQPMRMGCNGSGIDCGGDWMLPIEGGRLKSPGSISAQPAPAIDAGGCIPLLPLVAGEHLQSGQAIIGETFTSAPATTARATVHAATHLLDIAQPMA